MKHVRQGQQEAVLYFLENQPWQVFETLLLIDSVIQLSDMWCWLLMAPRPDLNPSSFFFTTGTPVTQVTATDADDPVYGNSAKLVYSILEGQPYFSIDPNSGKQQQNSLSVLISPTVAELSRNVFSCCRCVWRVFFKNTTPARCRALRRRLCGTALCYVPIVCSTKAVWDLFKIQTWLH